MDVTRSHSGRGAWGVGGGGVVGVGVGEDGQTPKEAE